MVPGGDRALWPQLVLARLTPSQQPWDARCARHLPHFGIVSSRCFHSSPFSLSVLENHKETPHCSWNSCQRDSSRIEHMALGSHTNKDIATFSWRASSLLPAWAPHPGKRGSLCAWLAALSPTGCPHGRCTQVWVVGRELDRGSSPGNNLDTHRVPIPIHSPLTQGFLHQASF